MFFSHVSAAETSVQQASKQVQVDLQDLGYETCGRSENEAEREDTSSPGKKQTKLLPNFYGLQKHTLNLNNADSFISPFFRV